MTALEAEKRTATTTAQKIEENVVIFSLFSPPCKSLVHGNTTTEKGARSKNLSIKMNFST